MALTSPAAVTERPSTSSIWLPGYGDAVTVLTVYAVALIAIPSRLVFGPLGGAGSPATVVGLGCLMWWMLAQLSRPAPTFFGSQPVRVTVIGFCLAVLASYVAASVRPIDGPEYNSATLGLILLAGWAGVLLVANDGIPSIDRLLDLVRRIVALGAGMATLGITQFVTHQTLVDRISIPGLSANHTGFGLTMREGFTRPAGTATHPIEYGAVITMFLPLALALAMGDQSRSAVRRWTPVALMAICVPLSISRSALLACAVGTVILLVSWPKKARRVAFGVTMVGSVAVYLLIPGMLGSLLGLFTGIGGDSSAQSRTGSYSIAGDFVSRSPIFGRGFQTFLPSYRILDNQYLGLLIEIGAVGLLFFLALIASAVVAARTTRRHADSEVISHLGQGLVAAVASGAVTLALFDGLSFPMSAGAFFLILGLAGGSRRLVLAREGHQEEMTAWDWIAASVRRWYVVVAGILLALGILHGIATAPGVYSAQTQILFLAPVTPQSPNTISSPTSGVISTAGLVERIVNRGVEKSATSGAVSLTGQGVDDGQSVELPNAGGQWASNFNRPVLQVQVTGSTKEEVQDNLDALIDDIRSTTSTLQVGRGVSRGNLISTQVSPSDPGIAYNQGHRRMALVVTGILALAITMLAAVAVDRIFRRRLSGTTHGQPVQHTLNIGENGLT